MATLTDPACELSEIAKRLIISTSEPGEKLLAKQFGVDVWSTAFVKIITCIFERADAVASIVKRSGLDPEVKSSALNDLDEFKMGFASNSLTKSWNTDRNGLVRMREHGRNLGFLQDTVRNAVCYPKLNEQEAIELLVLIDAYVDRIEQESDFGAPFVRQAIIDGLETCRFQLRHFGWTGSGYTLAAFREVASVYAAVERQIATSDNPDAGAVLRGFGAILRSFKEKIETARGYTTAANFVWTGANALATFSHNTLAISHHGA